MGALLLSAKRPMLVKRLLSSCDDVTTAGYGAMEERGCNEWAIGGGLAAIQLEQDHG